MKLDPIAELKRLQGKKTARDFAKEIPCSPAYLSDLYRGNRLPGPLILKFLGIQLKRTVSVVNEYERIS